MSVVCCDRAASCPGQEGVSRSLRHWEVSSLWLGSLKSRIGRIWVVWGLVEVLGDGSLNVMDGAAGIRIWSLVK